MGYDLHITRAYVAHDSARYPILDDEVVNLVRAEPDLAIPPDAPRHPGFCFVNWTADTSDQSHHLLFHDGRLSIKHPEPAFTRRMIELAVRLDAWVIGDDADIYEWSGRQVMSHERGREAFEWRQRWITRGKTMGGLNRDAPIQYREWIALVDGQPDFAMAETIEATLPAGIRQLPCPPVACWTGHPSGRPVPFFFDEDVIEVRYVDEPIVRRMTELAAALDAKAVDEDGQPA
jgi:hypothetical protein